MSVKSSTLEEIEPILHEFGQRHAVIEKLEIFGSVATGRATPQSDVDVLVTFGPEAPYDFGYVRFFTDFHAELERLMGRRVDLISRNALHDDRFGYNANRQARTVYEYDRASVRIAAPNQNYRPKIRHPEPVEGSASRACPTSSADSLITGG